MLLTSREDFLPFNKETASDPCVTRTMTFSAMGGRQFRIQLQIPLYINGKLKGADFDLVESLVRDQAQEFCNQSVLDGSWWDERTRHQKLTQYACNAVYNQFRKAQVAAGNLEGHAVPRVLMQ